MEGCLFEQEQTVKVLKRLDINVGSILHLLGQKGIVIRRYKREKYNENWYDVQFPSGEVEPFCEYELDARFVKKEKSKRILTRKRTTSNTQKEREWFFF